MKLIFLINKNNDYAGLSNIINYALKKNTILRAFIITAFIEPVIENIIFQA
jgi:hypothetical protein